jgi:hypothetical protein
MGAFFSSLFSRTNPRKNNTESLIPKITTAEITNSKITNCGNSFFGSDNSFLFLKSLFSGSRQTGGTTRKRQIKQQKKSHQ